MGTLLEPLYDIKAPAGWIAERAYDLADESGRADAPYFFLLVDYQENIHHDRVWLKDNVLRFQTLVTPCREIVDRGEISQYKSGIEKMFDRSLNRCPWRIETGQDDAEPLSRLVRTALLIMTCILCLSLLFWAIG